MSYYYKDKRNKKHKLSNKDLDKCVVAKIEYQKSNNGKCNWSHLCSELRKDGVDAQQCENFRMLVRRYQKKIGKLPSKEKYSDLVSSEKLASLKEQIGELNIQKREIQNYSREFGKVRRDLVDEVQNHEELLNIARESVNVVPWTIDNRINTDVSNNEMVVVISDWHIGALVHIINNDYDSTIAEDAIQGYLMDIMSYIRVYKPKSIKIVNLGDTIENAYMRFNQSFDVEMNVSEQETKAIQFVTNFVRSVVALVDGSVSVCYTGIMGNHDRTSGNKKNNLYGDSFATVLNAMVQVMSEQIDNLHYIEPNEIHRTALEANGSKLAFVHGDLNNLSSANCLAEISQFDGTHYDAVVGGHLHCAKIMEQNGWVIQSGSLIGPTSYSDKLSKLASRSQEIIIIDQDGNIQPNIVKL